MDDDERGTPDSLTGKLRELFESDVDEEATAGARAPERDAGAGEPDAADDAAAQAPKRPTDPPF